MPSSNLDKVSFELRSTGARDFQNPKRTGIHTRGYLPHVKREGASYFVTFRLADSLPKEVLMKIQTERAERLTQYYANEGIAKKPGATPFQLDTLDQIERDYFRKVERYLDKGSGECWLKRSEIAELVCAALRYFDGQRFIMKAWVVMS